MKIKNFTWITDKQAHGSTGTYLVDIKVLDDCQKAAFLGWISIEVHCSRLCLNRMTFSIESDQSLTPGESGRWCIRAPRISEMAKQHSPRQQKDHRARKHSFFLPLSQTATNRRQEGRKDESAPALFWIVPMYWAFSGRTGPLQCFVWIHYCTSVFLKLFNCWRVMRHDYCEFNADTIEESFSFFTTYYKIYYVPHKWHWCWWCCIIQLFIRSYSSMNPIHPMVSNNSRLNTIFLKCFV